MNLTTPQQLLAESYGVSRTSIYRLRKRLAIDAAELTDPETVFQKLLNGRKSPLRTRLSNPATREAIADELDITAIRGESPDIKSKIKSIQ